MTTTKAEYERHKKEVIKYLNAVKLLDTGNCEILCTDVLGARSSLKIDDELSKILKANSFILLYNLIESTITNSIKAIVHSVEDEKLTYEQLSENIKHLWIRQSVKGIKDNHYAAKVHQISESIVKKELLTLSHECVNISGNIDAQEIRNIAKQFGWVESKNGRELVTIKNKRNHLAHGEFSFADVGKDYTMQDIIRIKDNALKFLEDVLSNVNNFLQAKGYKI
ncbi:MAG: hypothetical protein K2N34_10960 [Lachnospiraceae bacterium]|nr:hypothetical protein [Lachnospiraceae bacterium]